MPGVSGSGNFTVAIAAAELEEEQLDPDNVLEGDPHTSGRVVWESADGRIVRGIWQCTPGVLRDVEADEMFVVICGRATIEFEDGVVLEIGPSDLGILEQGARTTWTVHETLRKAYQITVHE
jgi:uncharacterized cupin superfamily protein